MKIWPRVGIVAALEKKYSTSVLEYMHMIHTNEEMHGGGVG